MRGIPPCILAALFTTALYPPAEGGIALLDDPRHGPASIIRDDVHALDFLTLDRTLGHSFEGIALRLAPGEAFEGWRIASLAEMRLLGQSAEIAHGSSDPGALARAEQLRGWLCAGCVEADPGHAPARGLIADLIEVDGQLLPQAFNVGKRTGAPGEHVAFEVSGHGDPGDPGESVFLVRPVPVIVELRAPGPADVRIRFTTAIPLAGGALAIAYDPSVARPTLVKAGLDFPGSCESECPIFATLDLMASCGGGAETVMVIGWLASVTSFAVLPPGSHDLLSLALEPAGPAGPAGCETFRFVECVTPWDVAVRNVASSHRAQSYPVLARECFVEQARQLPGDCDQDGRLALPDAICILGYLFRHEPAALPCGDGRLDDPANRWLLNLNGDERGVDLADAVHLLHHLFSGGPPPAPGKACIEVAGCPPSCSS